MRFFENRGPLGPPPDPFRMRQPPGPFGSPRALRWLGLGVALLVGFFALSVFKSIYVDLLWFDSVGFEHVYRRVIVARVALFLAGATIAAAVLGANIWIARRLAPRGLEESFIEEVDPQAIRRVVSVLLIAGTAFVALIFGATAAGAWQTLFAWRQHVSFGVVDPQFSRDASFYLFDLPAYQFIQSWMLGLLIMSALAAGAVYGLAFSLQRFIFVITRGIRVHLSLLGGLALIAIAAGIGLTTYDLATSSGGIVDGLTYTDVNARVPVRLVLVVLSAAAGATVIANAFLGQGFRVPAFAVGAWLFASVVGGGLYPAAMQSLQVEPNELEKEAPYIAHNIRFTRLAYGLDSVEESDYPARPALTVADIAANQATIDNARLWDSGPLRETLTQLQSIRPFYMFNDIDIDRYTLQGRERQVMLGVRELDISRVQANWTRERLQLTHGFGAVVTTVNEVIDEGLPNLLVRDIPPASNALPVSIEGSRIYFGERTTHYVVVRTNVAEFDYPLGDGNAETRYEPDRGIPLSNAFRRLALAWELGDSNLLISGQLGSDSRVLMHRQLAERIRRVAPFLQLDPDPYAVILDGRIVWIQDAYTTTNRFPYSQHAGGVNYIRNSVKITVDALTGDMAFYLVDPTDPIAATWARIFPRLFQPADEVPANVREHLRYPAQMFQLQAELYLRYHITDPRVFFVGEDVWMLPFQQAQSAKVFEPYYVTMRLPGETDEEFVIVMPFTPRNKQNTIAWLAGRSDPEHYGTLRAYRFPSDSLVFGPAQVEARIDQHPGVSQQLTLWNQAGSNVIRGNLFMLPIADSFLFVGGIYLQADNSPLPELKRIVVANGNAIAMEPTFIEALEVVLGQRPSTLPGGGGAGAPGPGSTPTPRPATATATPGATATAAPGSLRQLIEDVRRSSQAAQQELDRLRALLDQIESQAPR
ncbi:MAG: UPF0182 family protein [Chloroflexi bacterium]|nr:UPF0182 family protein [Chloroflexota bacterium]